MKIIRLLSIASLLLVFSIACKKQAPVPMDLNKNDLIPKPVYLEATNSSFELTKRSVIYVDEFPEEIQQIGHYLAEHLRPATGFKLPVEVKSGKSKKGNITLHLSNKIQLPSEEGFRLTITEKQVLLEARKPVGLFRGIQTIRQLLPSDIEKDEKQKTAWRIATGMIVDYPEYEYRGTMLDVSRHFFGLKDVEQYMEYLAYYKMNALHLHLSDDQGWRIEIKSWPNLTAIGGQTQVGGGEGGFYTQEEFKELIQYAKERYITIVPEIDMPGHTNAALASYAELNCDSVARELYTGTNVGFSTLCTDKEITYQFVDDVVRELSEMNPGPYMHIGGDESHVTPLKDYIPFINRVKKIVEAHGKTMIGWDEIAHANIDSGTVVQFWSNVNNAWRGIQKGAKVIVSPAQRTYIDMKYDSTTELGLNWAAYIEVDRAYNWDPARYNMKIQHNDILGVESPLWSETVTNLDEIEFLAFPRLIAHAEIGWTAYKDRTWDDFKQRLGAQGKNMEALGINFYRSPKVPWVDDANKETN